MYNISNFGKYEDYTIEQVILKDPDYFFWGHENDVFLNQSGLDTEMLRWKISNIKIPQKWNNHEVRYLFDRNGHFITFDFVAAQELVSSPEQEYFLESHLDFYVVKDRKKYDKLGYRNFLSRFKKYYLGSPTARITKKRAHEFFNDESNFCPPRKSEIEPIVENKTLSLEDFMV